MAGKLNVYNLGSNGVNVDSNPTQLQDGELTKAQNAIHDPLGSEGGLRKRAGLTKVNSVAAAGAIRGGTGIPLSIGGQSVGPGGTAPVAGRTIYVGRATLSTDIASGWYSTVDAYTTATAITTFANPVSRTKRIDIGAPAVGRWTTNTPAGVLFKNRLYYAGDNYTVGTTAPEIRVWDGVTDRQLCRVPGFFNAGSTHVETKAVMQMVAGADGFIYITTFGTGTTSASFEGHVWQLNPENGAIKGIGAKFTGQFPNAVFWYSNRLWVGTYTGDTAVTTGKIYVMRPDVDTAFTLSYTSTKAIGINNFASYRGLLFATADGGSSSEVAVVAVRSAVGVWTTSLSGAGAAVTCFLGAVVFKGNLYVSYFESGGVHATIKKYDGSSWTTAYTAVNSLEDNNPFFFFQDNGTLYAVSPYGDQTAVMVTTDGSSWASKQASFNVLEELIPVVAAILT